MNFMQTSGEIRLRMLVVEGELFRDTETFGQMDPFLIIEHNNKKYKTSVHQDGGKTPKWNHEVLIPIRSKNDTLKITCYDEDVIMDSFVGQHTYTVSTIAKAKETVDTWYPLFY